MSSAPVTLDYEQFEQLFPFHFVLDSSLRVIAVGSVLGRICPQLTPGVAVNDILSPWLIGPEGGGAITRNYIDEGRSGLFVFRARLNPLMLRMQLLRLANPERFVFIGSPWVRSPAEVRELGLVLGDFAVHDSTIDLLQTVQTTALSLGDAKVLLSRVESQRDDLKDLIARAGAPIVALDLHGRLTEWNAAAEAVTGVARATALGRPFVAEFVRPDSRAAADAFVTRALAGEAPDPMELLVSTARGGAAHLLLGASVRHGADKQVSGLLLVGQDISSLAEQRDTLEAMVAERTHALTTANSDLAQAIRAKDMFLSTMSHETRTPLHAILGLLESLSLGAYGEVTPRQNKLIATISESAQHLLSLVNDILDVAKIGAGSTELEVEKGDVRALCESSVRLVTPQAAKKGVAITTELAPEAQSARFDPRRMKQVLVNLLTNAVKFTPTGGRIQLSVATNLARQTIEFRVSDSGIGILPEDQRRIFQAFTQVDTGPARSYGGTGLGLTLTLRLIELHGGGLRVESEPNRGSLFVVVLPWQPAGQETAVALSAPADAAPDAPTVLVVAGTSRQTHALSELVSRAGFRTVEVLDGANAVQFVSANRPPLVLIDIQTQILGGIDAIRRLRDAGVAGTPGIVAISSLSIVGDSELCLEAGASSHLLRPVNDASIIAALHQALAARVRGPVSRNG